MIALFLTAVLSQQSSYMEWMLQSDTDMRTRGGLSAHVLNAELCRAAQWQANAMAKTLIFDHCAAGGDSKTRAQKCGYPGWDVRENISKNAKWPDGKLGFLNPWDGWLTSPAHYGSIMSRTTDVGFGWATDANGITYWCAVYGNP